MRIIRGNQNLTSPVMISDADPRLRWEATGSGADAKVWEIEATGNTLLVKTLTDLYGAGATAITITRSGTTISSYQFATGVSLFADGTAAAPSVSFINDTDTGIYSGGANDMRIANGGADLLRFSGTDVIVTVGGAVAWGSTGVSTVDVRLTRDAANVLALRNGTTSQAFKVYNTFTDTSNYERFESAWVSNTHILRTINAGTGSARELTIGPNGAANLNFQTTATVRWYITTDGHLLTNADNVYDVAGSGTRARTGYFGTRIVAGLATGASGQVYSAVDGDEAMWSLSSAITDPSSPRINFNKSRGTHAAPSNVVDGDAIVKLRGRAYSGATGYWDTAEIRFIVDGAVTDNQRPPSRLEFYTNASNAAVTKQLEINNAGLATFTAGAVFGASKVYINDTANAKMTVGLTVNQGANADEAFALKQSGVAHGITDHAETDTMASMWGLAYGTGGVDFRGFTAGSVALQLNGFYTTDVTTKTTASNAAIQMNALLKSGTGITNPGADANLAVIRANGTTRFIFDAEGSAHADVEWIAFDKHDDVVLLDALNALAATNLTGQHFGEFLHQHKVILQREKIVTFYDNTNRRVMLNATRLSMLLTGAVRQLGAKLSRVYEALESLGIDPKRLEA